MSMLKASSSVHEVGASKLGVGVSTLEVSVSAPEVRESMHEVINVHLGVPLLEASSCLRSVCQHLR